MHSLIGDAESEEIASALNAERFGVLFSGHPLPMWIYDLETLAFLDVNDAAVETYGYSRAEFLVMRLTDIRSETEAARLLAAAPEERGAVQRSGQWRHTLRDGRVLDVEISLGTITFRGRAAALVVVHDVTERNHATIALRESEARKAAILDSVLDCIVTMDAHGRVIEFNAAAERTFLYTRTETIGRSLSDLIIPPALRGAHAAGLARFLATGEGPLLGKLIEVTAVRSDGFEIPVELTITAIHSGKTPIFTGVLRDITARKHADEARARLAAIVDSSDDAIMSTSPDDLILTWNAGAERLYGYAANEVIGRKRAIIVPPEKSDELATRLEKAARGEPGETFESQRTRKDGSTIDVSLTISPMIDPSGRVTGACSVARDITGRKNAEAELKRLNDEMQLQRQGLFKIVQNRAEELEHEILARDRAEFALREERDRAQRYLDTAEVILLALDMEGRITLVNRYACAVFGWTEDELIGRDFIETCVPAGIRDETRNKLRIVFDGDDSIVDNAIVTKAGEVRMVEWRNTLLRDDQGRVVSTFSSGTDITARNQAIESLRTAEERMRFALVAAGVGIWDRDFKSGSVRMSEILESQYGLEPGSFDGQFETITARVHPDDLESLRGTVQKAATTGSDFTLLNRAIWPDGTVRWLSGAGRFFLGEDGEPMRGVGISMDVTEQHSLEEQYQQAQKMEAIGRLAGGVAHDFNNLLTAILGYCELLLDDRDPNVGRQKDIGEIQRAGLSAASLTRQLLAFSRKEIIEPKLLDVNEVVGGIKPMLARLIGEDVKILLGLRPHIACVKADRAQVEQIVLNLAVNARDAMPNGGTLTIETANVELDADYTAMHLSAKPGPYVSLIVTDTGTGMTELVKKRLFEPFFTTKEPGKGTGLGLATVYGIVTRAGGSVNVYSEVGMGTCIRVYFPRVDPVEMVSEVTLSPVAAPRVARETVLVVEDADELRELTRRLLQRQGYTVLVAADADEALQLFELNASIDVLLTDVVMPGASGPVLAKRLVEQRPSLKVLYMSGYTEEAIVHHGVLDAGIAFLHKPFTSETLGRKLREVLDR